MREKFESIGQLVLFCWLLVIFISYFFRENIEPYRYGITGFLVLFFGTSAYQKFFAKKW